MAPALETRRSARSLLHPRRFSAARRGSLSVAAALVALLVGQPSAVAQNILRRPGTATGNPSDASAAAAAQAAAAQAAAAFRAANSPLRQALDSVKQLQAAQSAARAAAQAAAGGVPDGLAPFGLQLLPGTAPIHANGPTTSRSGDRTQVTVVQTDQRSVITWGSFNIGLHTDLFFDQSLGGSDVRSWAVLNRVIDPFAAPSKILGSIRAAGQVYVLDRNGVIFGGASQVNVGTLVASAWDFDGGDQAFLKGTLNTLRFRRAAGDFAAAGTVAALAGSSLASSSFGRVMLLGGTVVNKGAIDSPDGQVIFAGADSIALQAPGDLSALRGLPVPSLTGGGLVQNDGAVTALRGNVTLLGASETRQNGLVTSTTSSQANGSIWLGPSGIDGNSVTTLGPASQTLVLPDLSGVKVIGGGSFLPSTVNLRGAKILLEDGARIYAPAGNVTLQARMVTDPTGAGLDDTRVYLGAGATIDVSGLREVAAPMEQNSIQAELRANELRDNPLLRNNPALRGRTVYFDARLGVLGGVADLSGYYDLISRDVTQLMTRGGSVSLAAKEIVTRQGSLIDLSGGSLRFLDGYVRSSSLLDSSGHRVRIEDAVGGVRYVGIDGDFVLRHPHWNVTETFTSLLTRARPSFEKGYEQGGSAGALAAGPAGDPAWFQFDANSPKPPSPSASLGALILDGDVAAGVVTGPKQRELPTFTDDPTLTWRAQPARGSFTLAGSGNVTFADLGTQLGASFRPDGSLARVSQAQTVLPTRFFDGRTFSGLSITSGFDANSVVGGEVPADPGSVNQAPGGNLTIARGTVLDLGEGGSFSFVGNSAIVGGTIRAAGGSVKLEALEGAREPGPAGLTNAVVLTGTGVIDVAGRLTNDALDRASRGNSANADPLVRALNGGGVSIAAQAIQLSAGSLIDASGGARIDTSGAKVTRGAGGSISLDVSRPPKPGIDQREAVGGASLLLDGELRAFALGKGGSLALATPFAISIAEPGAPVPAGSRYFSPDFFTRGGFASYTLIGERGVTVAQGTTLAPSTASLLLPGPGEPGSRSDLGSLATGARLDDLLARGVLPADQRNPMSLQLSSVPVRAVERAGNPLSYTTDVVLPEGASIRMDPGSTVLLSAPGTVEVDGTIEARGGSLTLRADALGANASNLFAPPVVKLGDKALLSVPGWVQTTLDGAQFKRTVQPGGSITLSSPGEVEVAPNARLDASGITAIADLQLLPGSGPGGRGGTSPQVVAGDAGSLSVTAGVGVIRGRIDLHAGPGGGDRSSAGAININRTGLGATGPLIIAQDVSSELPLAAGLTVIARSLDQAGADDLTLQTIQPNASTFNNSSAILFQGFVELTTRRSITLAAPVLAAAEASASAVRLSSGYIQLRGGGAGLTPRLGSAGLGAELFLEAGLIDVDRTVVLGCVANTPCAGGGFGAAHLISTGDLRLSDHDPLGNVSARPGLFSAGALDLQVAQVYAASRLRTGLSSIERDPGDDGFLLQSDRAITIGRTSAGPTSVPLSFGERLTLRAPTIAQGGILRAPEGQIILQGACPSGSTCSTPASDDRVTLLPGSLTSASAEGSLLPFGPVQAGGVFFGYDKAGQAPTKAVRLDAPDVRVEKGAVIDVAGGSDLLGFSFIPGNGGSKDVLAGAFAVLPSLGSRPAPIGSPSALSDAALKVGDSVWLQGAPGLADGLYSLLPGRYALLPGGFLVRPLGGSFAAAPPTAGNDDGSFIASGWRTLSGAPGYSRFQVLPGAAFNQYSQYSLYSFDEYSTQLAAAAGAQVRTPYDAGSVVLAATGSLSLAGTGRFGAGKGGLLGNLDIAAPKIALLAGGSAAPGTGYLSLDAASLTNFGAGSVLLGGTRSSAVDPVAGASTAVAVSASDVYVATSAAAPFSAPEIILAATGSVRVADGSVLKADGSGTTNANPILLHGDGALLRLSTGARAPLLRTGATGASGDVSIGSASGPVSLSTSGSLTLDGSQGVSLSQAAALSARQFDLASLRVNLGDTAFDPAATGLTLGADKLLQFAQASDLLVRGYDSIRLYGNLSLGSRDASGAALLKSITLDTGLLQGAGAPGSAAALTAGSLTLQNSGGGGQGAPGSGTLALDVDTLSLGPGRTQLAGFGRLAGQAGSLVARSTGSLVFGGQSGQLPAFGGDVTLAVREVRAAAAASYAIDVLAGNLSLTHASGDAPAGTSGLGGRLSLRAGDLLLDTSISLPAGALEANARGALRVGANAVIDVGGRTVSFYDQERFAPGGTIRLLAGGALDVQPGSRLDVSGSSQGGDAGGIDLLAGASASVLGTLSGGAGAGYSGGAFSLDSGSVGPGALPVLNAALESSGFDLSRRFRLRQQDLTLGASDSIHAHDVVLTSDVGRVVVAGQIIASGSAARPDGGQVQLVGGNGVALLDSARVDARAASGPADGLAPASGRIEIAAAGGRLDAAPGAILEVGGGRSGGGVVVLRAPRDGNDVAIDRFAASVRGAREIDVQGSQTYQASAVDPGPTTTLSASASAWLQASLTNVLDRLFAGESTTVRVAPAVLVRSAGDLTVNADLDLSRIASGGTPGFLGLQAAGTLDLAASISDGFDSASRGAALLGGRTFSYGLEAGLDLVLEPGALLRTGTGNISLAAGRDLRLAEPLSGTDIAAVVYTAGAKAATPGFKGPLAAPGEHPVDGGDLTLRAGRDILAPFAAQSTSAWLYRNGSTAWNGDLASSAVIDQSSWSIVFANFQQAIGALGGGDVRVGAGRDVVQLQVALPSTGFLSSAAGAAPTAADLTIRGGGDLDLTAGRDLLGGLFMLGRGHAALRAGGSVLPSGTLRSLRTGQSTAPPGPDRTVGLLLGLMDATATVAAAGDLYIEGAFDPARQGQVPGNLVAGAGSAFWGYTDRTSLQALSLGGKVTYENDPWASVDLTLRGRPEFQVTMSGTGGLNDAFGRAPPALRLAALSGQIVLEDHFGNRSTLFVAPASFGTLELLARGDIHLALATLQIEDRPHPLLRGPLAPFAVSGDALTLGANASYPTERAADTAPVRLYSLEGSLCAQQTGSCLLDTRSLPARLTAPKPLDLRAGLDVLSGSFTLSNNGNQVSQVLAGRDIYEAAFLAHDGSLLLEAGRNLVLNQYDGAKGGALVTQGPPLGGSKASDLYVLAGAQSRIDFQGFAAAYLDPGNGHGLVKTYLTELARYLSGLDLKYAGLPPAALVAAFRELPRARQEIFLDQIYFNELRQTGIDYNDPASPRHQSYARGDAAIRLLFPDSAVQPDQPPHAGAGDVLLNAKPVETQGNGNVYILAPYGRIAVGADVLPPNANPSAGGIVTRLGGSVDLMAEGNIDLFTSRVFTLEGGDLLMWTSLGSITAGAGSKTSVLQRPLAYLIDPAGVISVNAFGLQTGAGIGVLDALLGGDNQRPRSRLDLIAPNGEVDAGDAGIRVVGDLNIAAQVVVGIENIQVSGSANGIPKVDLPNLGALSTASQAVQATSQESALTELKAKNAAADLPSIVTVEAVGYEVPETPEEEAERKRSRKEKK